MLDLHALRARLPHSPLTRFAPSPTGYLHLGHVVNAIYVWGLAGALGGRVLLRIEDHDRLRSRPEYERALLEDLAWLGFEADAGTVRQSDDLQAYERALAALASAHRVYACSCSRKEIAAPRYDGRCRDRGLPFSSGFGVRVQIEAGEQRFDDGRMGAQAQSRPHSVAISWCATATGSGPISSP